jgi:hypothetical protein
MLNLIVFFTELQAATLQQDADALRVAVLEVERLELQQELGDDYKKARKMLISLKRIEGLKNAMLYMDRAMMTEIRGYHSPPKPLHQVVQATLLILGDPEDSTEVS